MRSLEFDLCLMHMFERFKFEFVVWLDLKSKEKIKRKGNRFRIKRKTKRSMPPLPLGLLAHPARLDPCPPRSLYMAGPSMSAPPLHRRALSLSLHAGPACRSCCAHSPCSRPRSLNRSLCPSAASPCPGPTCHPLLPRNWPEPFPPRGALARPRAPVPPVSLPPRRPLAMANTWEHNPPSLLPRM
jgi:hypothetical protein